MNNLSYIITSDAMKIMLLKFRSKKQRDNALLLYAHIFNKYYNKGKKNLLDEQNYFELPSAYLKSIVSNYASYMKVFIDCKILEYKKNLSHDEDGVVIEKKDYFCPKNKYGDITTKQGRAMKYRFIEEPEKRGKTHYIKSKAKEKRWYSIINETLKEFGYDDIRISRNNYGRRVYHNAIREYKTQLKGYGLIDSITSHPRLIYSFMKENKIYDKKYMEIFENELDFYREMTKISDATYLTGDPENDRNRMKKIFASWINGNEIDYFGFKYHFPVLYNYVSTEKHPDYKKLGRNLTLYESSIWIDDLLENIPVKYALPVHDCLIVKSEDLDVVYEYCKMRQPNLRFSKKII